MCLVQCVNEWAIDYLENVLLPLDNYISKGTDVFLTSQNPNFLQLTNQVRGPPSSLQQLGAGTDWLAVDTPRTTCWW